jgi:hypothetical protein
MRSAFKRGIELLSEPESDSAQSQGKTMESASKYASECLEGVGGVPKNVTQLKPAIDKLMSKAIMITICRYLPSLS